jgi:hypothetical protein
MGVQGPGLAVGLEKDAFNLSLRRAAYLFVILRSEIIIKHDSNAKACTGIPDPDD